MSLRLIKTFHNYIFSPENLGVSLILLERERERERERATHTRA